MNVECAHSSGVAGLILALQVGIVELVSMARSQHARGTIKIREIGALQERRGAGHGERRERSDEGTNNEGLGC